MSWCIYTFPLACVCVCVFPCLCLGIFVCPIVFVCALLCLNTPSMIKCPKSTGLMEEQQTKEQGALRPVRGRQRPVFLLTALKQSARKPL